MAIHTGYREASFDCLLNSLMQRKRNLAESALWPMGDTDSDADQLQKMVSDGVPVDRRRRSSEASYRSDVSTGWTCRAGVGEGWVGSVGRLGLSRSPCLLGSVAHNRPATRANDGSGIKTPLSGMSPNLV
jgi:hypothetical protein